MENKLLTGKIYIRNIGVIDIFFADKDEEDALANAWKDHVEMQNDMNYLPDIMKVSMGNGKIAHFNPFEVIFIIFDT